jgi:D-serine deaminase-like pyridoxal phosphate-dependent protein
MRTTDLDTPAILIDLDVMERNLLRGADYARSNGLRLRPHTKTHKIPALGARQLELGACGLSVAKTTEADVMLASGTTDLLIAYPVVGHQKTARLTELAKKVSVTVAVDSLAAARPISDAARAAGVEIGLLAEMDAGLHRVGVPPGEDLEALARGLARLPHIRWRGIAFYPGHIKDLGEAGRRELEQLRRTVRDAVHGLKQKGLVPEIVSGGSTPLLWESHTIPELNEIRPGTYIFNDRNTVLSGACGKGDCAATILATVVSVAPDRIIIDGGSKTFSSDRPSGSSDVTFGEVVGHPRVRFHKMNEEHGFIDLNGAPGEFSVGGRLRVVPNHICVAMNLHETVYGVRGEEVEHWWRVEGRGKLQ